MHETPPVGTSERNSEGTNSELGLGSSSISSMASGFDDFDRWQAHTELKTVGESLQAAANAVFPTEKLAPYSKVYVLMISWEGDVSSTDVTRLYGVFRDIYHFETELWRIPDENCDAEVSQKIAQFVQLGGNSDEHLKIVYYAGHGGMSKNQDFLWTRCVFRFIAPIL